jgi:Na+/phosphate symporter|tara:strand:+ start:751 stop:1173 length:423 start_codon:yes stop_codon:yes gene_type:complete
MPSKIPIKFIYHYIGSAVLFMTVIFLLMYLGNVKIPPENKDIFVAITGSLSASLAMVISVLIGKSPEEVEELKKKNESLKMTVEQLVKQKDSLEALVISTQKDLVDNLSLFGSNFIDNLYNSKLNKKCICGENDCSCKGK